MDCKSAQALVHRYIDNELAATTAAAIAGHLEVCAACHQVYQQHEAVRSAIREHAADSFPLPPRLIARIQAGLTAAGGPAAGTEAMPRSWHRVAALLVLTVVVTSILTFFLTAPSKDAAVADEAISGHLRSLIVDHLTDISSSDPQTVQAWLAGKLDFSPLVKDLTGHGFDLVGGRLDYMYNREVAAVIYRRDQHVINLFIWPATSGHNSTTRILSDEGFSILLWTRSGINFCSISDLREPELMEFSRAYGARTI